MIDIAIYINALRRHDFTVLPLLIRDISDDFQDKFQKPIGADELQDYLLYLLVRSDLSEENDGYTLALLYQLTAQVEQFRHGDICYSLNQLIGAFLTAFAIKREGLIFVEQESLRAMFDAVRAQSDKIMLANEAHSQSLFHQLEGTDVSEGLRPYFLKEQLESGLSSYLVRGAEVGQVFIQVLAKHERVTPTLALYLVESYRNIALKLPKAKRKVLHHFFNKNTLEQLEAISQTREAFAEGLTCDELERAIIERFDAISDGGASTQVRLEAHRAAQTIRFFTPPRRLLEAESVQLLRTLSCR